VSKAFHVVDVLVVLLGDQLPFVGGRWIDAQTDLLEFARLLFEIFLELVLYSAELIVFREIFGKNLGFSVIGYECSLAFASLVWQVARVSIVVVFDPVHASVLDRMVVRVV